jgi:hypothetical protein
MRYTRAQPHTCTDSGANTIYRADSRAVTLAVGVNVAS